MTDATLEQQETWTAEEVGHYLRLSARQVRRLATRKELPGVKFGTDWRFHRQAIMAIMKGGTHEVGTQK